MSERLYLIYSVVHPVGLIPTSEPWPHGRFSWDLGAHHTFHIAIFYGRKLRHVGKGGIAVCSVRKNGFIFLGRVWQLQGPFFSIQHSSLDSDVCHACPLAVFPDGLLELCLHSSLCKLRSHFQKLGGTAFLQQEIAPERESNAHDLEHSQCREEIWKTSAKEMQVSLQVNQWSKRQI